MIVFGVPMTFDLADTTIENFPHAFINRRGEPVLIKPLDDKRRSQLLEMYLHFEPRPSFSGLPPAGDDACNRWVEGMCAEAVNLVALSFDAGVVGHTALFPIDHEACEMICALARRYRHIGIGTELTRCISQLAHELGFETIKLHVEARNHVARHVYEKCGFQYTTRGMVDELDMSLDLSRRRPMDDVRVGDIMNRAVVSIGPRMSCGEAMRVLLDATVATLPVVNEHNELVGILSETDLIAGENLHKKVSEVLTRDVVAVPESCRIAKLVPLFRSRKLRCIPVLNGRKKLIGVVGRRDILAYYARGL